MPNKETKYSCPDCKGHFNKDEIDGTNDFFKCKKCYNKPHKDNIEEKMDIENILCLLKHYDFRDGNPEHCGYQSFIGEREILKKAISNRIKKALIQQSTLHQREMEDIAEMVANYSIDLCENSQQFKNDVLKIINSKLTK